MFNFAKRSKGGKLPDCNGTLFLVINEIYNRKIDPREKKDKAIQVIRKNTVYPEKLKVLKKDLQNMSEVEICKDLKYHTGSLLSEIQHGISKAYKKSRT